ncbi:adhesin biosynthesis transcription regulatory family protein (plasmid) [Pseudomonas sp. R4-76]|uniref:PapB/FocB family fimbrial expression transcriptional regulator n=1 Tax=unclassified Pseudomonas TaxID=196821 RepID=UPI003DA86C11
MFLAGDTGKMPDFAACGLTRCDEGLMARTKRDLVPGQVDPEHLRRLIGLTGITGEKVIEALFSYFVDGEKQIDIARKYGLGQPFLSRKIGDIDTLSADVREIAPFYLPKNIPDIG